MPTAPELSPVKSSNISHVGYDEPSRTLWVRFNSGATWRYADVPPDAHKALVSATSIGSYFAKHIKPHHAGEKT